jgi:hypothetical protein
MYPLTLALRTSPSRWRTKSGLALLGYPRSAVSFLTYHTKAKEVQAKRVGGSGGFPQERRLEGRISDEL